MPARLPAWLRLCLVQPARRHVAPLHTLGRCLTALPCLYRYREAKARVSGAQQGDRDFLKAACRFLPACTERQVRMAPDKCEPGVL